MRPYRVYNYIALPIPLWCHWGFPWGLHGQPRVPGAAAARALEGMGLAALDVEPVGRPHSPREAPQGNRGVI